MEAVITAYRQRLGNKCRAPRNKANNIQGLAQKLHSPSGGCGFAGVFSFRFFLFSSTCFCDTQTVIQNPNIYHQRRLLTTNCELQGFFPLFAFLLSQRQQLTLTSCFTTWAMSSCFISCCQHSTNHPNSYVHHHCSVHFRDTPSFDPSSAKYDSRYFHCYL